MSDFDDFVRMDQQENELITELRRAPIFLGRLEDEELEAILLERRELSLKFTEIYDRLLEGIRDPGAQEVVRQIIRDEYPAPDSAGGNSGLSHREDLVHDLEHLGLRRSRVISYQPSDHTQTIIDATFDAVHTILTKAEPQFQAIAFIRFWGEVLTAVEYEVLWHIGLSRYFEKPTDSKFYWFHFAHDRATRGFQNIRQPGYRGAFTHSDHLTFRLSDLLDRSGYADEVMDANREAASLKIAFYTQFR